MKAAVIIFTIVFFNSISLNAIESNGRFSCSVDSLSSHNFGNQTWPAFVKKTSDGNYLLGIRVMGDSVNSEKSRFGNTYLLKVTSSGQILDTLWYSLTYFLSDFLEFPDFYIVVTTDRVTMNGYTKDYICKYDKNWNHIWSKKIDVPKYPSGKVSVARKKNGEILFVTDEIANWGKSEPLKSVLAIRSYSLNGTMTKSTLIETENVTFPVNIQQTRDGNFFLTASALDSNNHSCLWFLKLDTKGDTVWTKLYPSFQPIETLMLADSGFFILGEFTPERESGAPFRSGLKLLHLDEDGSVLGEFVRDNFHYGKSGNIVALNNGHILFSAVIEEEKDKQDFLFLYELNQSCELVGYKKFDFRSGMTSFLFGTDGNYVAAAQSSLGRHDNGTFRSVLEFIHLSEE